MLTVSRWLLVDIKNLNNASKSCLNNQEFSEQMAKCIDLSLAFSKFHKALNNITDPEWICELIHGVCNKFNKNAWAFLMSLKANAL